MSLEHGQPLSTAMWTMVAPVGGTRCFAVSPQRTTVGGAGATVGDIRGSSQDERDWGFKRFFFSLKKPSCDIKIRNHKYKRKRWTRIEKEKRKLTLFADDRIVFIERPKESIDNFWELISEFGKIAKYKITKQKSVMFLYDSNKKMENEKKFNDTVYCYTNQYRIPKDKSKEQYGSLLDRKL